MEQQKQPQIKNLLFFLVLSATILFGWMWLQSWLWPQPEGPKAKVDKKDQQAQPPAKQKQARAAEMVHFPRHIQGLPPQERSRIVATWAAVTSGPLGPLDSALYLDAERQVQEILAVKGVKVEKSLARTYDLG